MDGFDLAGAAHMDCLAVFSPEQVEAWFEWGGYFILFGLLFACGLGLPMPEDIPLLAAGYFVAQGKMSLVIASVVAWCGIIGGDCVLYYFGRRYGLNITRVPFVGKHLTRERILRAERLFERWGTWVVAIGRMFAGIRGAMVVAAGATRFSFIKFVIADGIAAVISGGLFVALGYWAGKKLGSIGQMRAKIKDYEHWVFLGIGLAVVGVVLWYWYRARKHKPTLADVALEKAVEKAQETQPGDAGASTNGAQNAPEAIAAPPAPAPHAPAADGPAAEPLGSRSRSGE